MKEKNEIDHVQELLDRGYEVQFIVDDWILEDILEDPFYNFKWFADVAKSDTKPLVKKYSIARELAIKAAEIVISSFIYGSEPTEQKKRIKFIVAKSMADSIDKNYEKEPLALKDVMFSKEELKKYSRQAEARLFNLMDRLEKMDNGGDEYHEERAVFRSQAFNCSYLCLRTDDPEGTFYLLWGLIDHYQERMQPLIDAYHRQRSG